MSKHVLAVKVIDLIYILKVKFCMFSRTVYELNTIYKNYLEP